MRRKARRGGARQVELTIEGLGALGDGLAKLEGRPVFLPQTLPGERVRARITGERGGAYRGEILELLEASADRVEAPCPHFGPCGGCKLQHFAAAPYEDWKTQQVRQALQRQGFSPEVLRPLHRVAAGSRRRAVFAATKAGGRLLLGFNQRASHRLVDLDSCLLLTPALQALLAPLRQALSGLLAEGELGDVAANETAEGIDLCLVSPRSPDLAAREALATFAEANDLARISWSPPRGEAEPIAQRRPPRVFFGGVAVEPPPGAFLQPSLEGEAFLTQRILDYLPDGAARGADLYAGCGTFTLPLARHLRVHAVEGDEAAVAALWAAARHADLSGRISVEARDLARQPVLPEELNGGDVVVFDPPRAGAREQAEALAASSIPTVIAISCNPQTLARDAAILCQGGYDLIEVTPLDQFPWTGHLELVALLRR